MTLTQVMIVIALFGGAMYSADKLADATIWVLNKIFKPRQLIIKLTDAEVSEFPTPEVEKAQHAWIAKVIQKHLGRATYKKMEWVSATLNKSEKTLTVHNPPKK